MGTCDEFGKCNTNIMEVNSWLRRMYLVSSILIGIFILIGIVLFILALCVSHYKYLLQKQNKQQDREERIREEIKMKLKMNTASQMAIIAQSVPSHVQVQSPVVQSPIVQSPIVQSPVVQSPAVQSPAVQSPAAQSPAEIGALIVPRKEVPKVKDDIQPPVEPLSPANDPNVNASIPKKAVVPAKAQTQPLAADATAVIVPQTKGSKKARKASKKNKKGRNPARAIQRFFVREFTDLSLSGSDKDIEVKANDDVTDARDEKEIMFTTQMDAETELTQHQTHHQETTETPSEKYAGKDEKLGKEIDRSEYVRGAKRKPKK